MTDKEFCKLDTEYYGEVVDNIKQISLRSFNGEELKEYVEHCIKLNTLNIASVSQLLIAYEEYKHSNLNNLNDGYEDVVKRFAAIYCG